MGISLKIIPFQPAKTIGMSDTMLSIMRPRSERLTSLSAERTRRIHIRDRESITKVTGVLELATSISMKMFPKKPSRDIGRMLQIGHRVRSPKKVKMFTLSQDGI